MSWHACTLMVLACQLLCALEAQATPQPSAVFEYLDAHTGVMAKADDWRDPLRPDERLRGGVAEGGSLASGERVEIPTSAVTWGTRLRARVRVKIAGPWEIAPLLEARSSSEWLSFVAEGPGRTNGDGEIVFTLVARKSLPRFISEVDGEVLWTLRVRRRTVDLGRSRHTLLVTAGAPQRANAWAITGEGTVPRRPDHNAFTLFRLRGAVRIAAGAKTATAAAEAAWRHTQRHYDLFAEPDVNPWALLEDGQYGQCMTAGAFIEAVHKILGFQSGRIVYVYPALSRPKNPRLLAFPHSPVSGAFTVEGELYDVHGQFRSVAPDAFLGARRHSARQAARHQGAHGIERLKFIDGNGHLHNYATAFVVDEDGRRTYFGGGYEGWTYNDAESFLSAACIAVVWTYEEGNSDEWETICDGPDGGYWWRTGERFRPLSKRPNEP